MSRGRIVQSHLLRGAACAVILAMSADGQTPAAAESARTALKSGYVVGTERCGGFPKLRIGMRAGYCAGLIASEHDGLAFPRTIVQVPDTQLFVVTDLGGWGPGRGRLLLLDPQAPEGRRLKVLMSKVDYPHGLAVGIDRRIYVSTDQRIFRFDPLTEKPETTVEVILQGLPGRRTTLSDGTQIAESEHPLKHFVFDRTGRIYVNIGAPMDSCTRSTTETKPCAAGEGPAPLAAIWTFAPPAGGIFPALKPSDPNPPREIYARGLRNSMGLAMHPQFPDAGYAFFQAENSRDLTELSRPNDELNLLEKGKHYGWPYCYDLTTASAEYRTFLLSNGPYRQLCTNSPLYKQPYSLLPPHAAPLSMLYYEGDKFAELKGKLIVGLHGYRPTGSRVIFNDVDAKGFPTVSPPPVRYKVSCAGSQAFHTEQQSQVPTAPFNELIAEWYKVEGVRPRGAPVGMTVASDGAIWLVEDRNKSILRLDVDTGAPAGHALPCP
jgi:glucose/arabinose dehydrogenase